MEQTEILRHAAETLEALGVPYLVVGSCASIAYGEARFTQDIDIVAALSIGPRPRCEQARRPASERAADTWWAFGRGWLAVAFKGH